MAPYFTPRSITALRDPVVAIVERLIDGWIDAGEIELVADFAVPLPVEVIAHVLNVPLDRMADFATRVEKLATADWEQGPYRAMRQNALLQLIGVSPDLIMQ